MKGILKQFKKKKVRQGLLVVIGVLLIIGGIFYYETHKNRVFIDNSIVLSPIINIAPSVQGKLNEIDVYENEKVKRGDPIAIVGGKTLYADTDGLIVMANTQIGSFVSPQTPVAQMVNISDFKIAGTLDENKGLEDIQVGQVASFTVDALLGQTFWGYVDEIAPSAKTTQLAFSISSERPTQQFVVYVQYNAYSYPQIKNGMSAKLTIFTTVPK